MSPEERRLLKELRAKKQAAESIFRALERAESAAVAAATASGKLQQCFLKINIVYASERGL